MTTIETNVNGVRHVKRVDGDTCVTSVRIPKISMEKIDAIRLDIVDRAAASHINESKWKTPADYRSRNSFIQFIIKTYVNLYEFERGIIDVTKNH
jgi:hypothetical protein